MKSSQLNHIALLVESIESYLKEHQFDQSLVGEVQEFDDIGTRELYIGGENQTARLLLMEGHKEGPYKRAFEKRGPGLHHIAIDVLNTMDFVNNLNGSGWLLHTQSLNLFTNIQQVFLCRPGIKTLIEINQTKEFSKLSPFISKVDFPSESTKLIESLGCRNLHPSKEFKLYF